MDGALKLIAVIVGGGGALTAIGVIVLYITKGAIAAAIKQAGDREIAQLKHELAQVLALERAEAERSLEQFKAQLTFEAEVRRQAATKKVEALLKLRP
jgi:hypothetical protein